MLKLLNISLELSCHGTGLLMTSKQFIVLLVVLGVLFIYSFIFNSNFLILIAKYIVLILKLMEFTLHLCLFFKTHSTFYLTMLTLACVGIVSLALQVGIVLR